MRKLSASGSTVSSAISPKLSSSCDEWRKDDHIAPPFPTFVIFHALLNLVDQRKGGKKELEIQLRKKKLCHLSLSAIFLWADNVWVCFAHSVAGDTWKTARLLLYFFIQMGAHKIDVRWDIVVARLMSVFRPLEVSRGPTRPSVTITY